MKRPSFSILAPLSLLLVLSILSGFFYTQKDTFAFWSNNEKELEQCKKEEFAVSTSTAKTPQDIKVKIPIECGDSYTSLMQKAGISRSQAINILNSLKPVYDLSRIRSGREIKLSFTPKEELKKIKYNINNQEELMATTSDPQDLTGQEWQALIKEIPYETKIVTSQGRVKSSMYKAAQKENIDIRTIVELAEVLQWTIDFAMQTREGDTFKIVYEKKYLEGEYIRPGRILAAQYINNGEKYEVFHYEGSEDDEGYYTSEGESAQKMFLRAPVAYKYISSGYTEDPRYLAKFQTFTSSHRAIDYAANTGTPIRAVGDGVVTSAGWNSSGYGYLTAIRHNSTYTTRYAHQSEILVSPGQRVSQGDVIGRVGSTGFSTGPHLHYEMIENGIKINPLNLELPPAESIAKKDLDDFKEAIQPYKEKLNK